MMPNPAMKSGRRTTETTPLDVVTGSRMTSAGTTVAEGKQGNVTVQVKEHRGNE